MARRRFLPGLRGLVETKQWGSSVAPLAVFSPMSDAARRAWPVERAVAEGYERTVWVYKSVDAIASHQSRLDFQLRDGDDVITDHPLCDLLNDGKANPLESGRQFRKRLSMQILLSPAGAFVEVTPSNAGAPIRLDLLPPGRTRPVPGKGADLLSHFETIAPDGRRIAIDPERVRWFRDPHPLDPFRGITPLEAAGLSVDLDYLSRLYNVVFIRSDGRPATVVSVEGKLSQPEADRIEARFGRGPMEAGKVSVINGKVSVADLGAHPRDMAYGEAASRSKEEVLTAFGVGESVLGNASGRTFDNAEQELYNFWTITMEAHMGIVTSGFDQDSDDGVVGELDTSKVEVLRRVAAARRAEMREEVAAGLASPEEYRKVAEYEEVDLPHTRALYIAQGKTPIPTREEDAVALGLAAPEQENAPPAGEDGGPSADSDPAAAEESAPEGDPGAGPAVDGDQPPTPPAGGEMGDALARLQSLLDTETKALPGVDGPSAPEQEDPRGRLEEDLSEALAALMRRLVKRTAARVDSPKARKGTRHWQPEYPADTRVGDAPLDVARIVDPAQWEAEAETALTETATAGGAAAAVALAAAAGLGAAPAGVSAVGAGAVADVVTWLAAGAAQAAQALGARIAAVDAANGDIVSISAQVHGALPELEAWGARTAVAAAASIMHAAETAAALELAGPNGVATATWITRRDTSVRPTHAEAHGQTQPAGGLFRVGDVRLRWPGDIAGPPEEVFGCRCRLRWTIVRSR
ncbi:phage portal protein (plasmid) [Streptosporangium sandarakinum]|uniref:phage portal protein n=1 Tax=Streptosporangium sandarakinum TaxID=1260955 RepID=UPI003D906EEE